jgi:hypothetical protein
MILFLKVSSSDMLKLFVTFQIPFLLWRGREDCGDTSISVVFSVFLATAGGKEERNERRHPAPRQGTKFPAPL